MESSHNARIADGPRRQARLSVVSFSMSETAASEWNLLTELHRMRGIHRRTRHGRARRRVFLAEITALAGGIPPSAIIRLCGGGGKVLVFRTRLYNYGH
jgi:hypothetical protein